MSSVAANRQSGTMANAQGRSNLFGDFNAAPSRHNSDERLQPSTLGGQTFGNGATWQAGSGIWGSNTIGSGFTNTKRDASRSRAADIDDFPQGSGSGGLAASSEPDPWNSRPNGPWNPDTTSPTLQSSHSGSTSPSAVRGSISSDTRGLLEVENSFHQSRPSIGQGASFGRSQPKSNLDPSSGPFKFNKPSFGYHDDKENSIPFTANGNEYNMDMSSRPFRADQAGSQNVPFLGIGSSVSRDGSLPPSRASDSGLNGNGLTFGNGHASYGSIGHTPNSSIHSSRPSFHQSSGSRYDINSQTDAELREKFTALRFDGDAESNGSHANSTPHTQNSLHIAQSNYQLNGGASMWTEASNGAKSFGNAQGYPNQPFADQVYYNKAPRFGDRGSVSPAGSDYRRGLNSPKYYSATGTPPQDQIYRPVTSGTRVQQGQSELDRRLQSIHFAQQAYMQQYGQFQGQFPPQLFEYPQPTPAFRPGNSPYGYQMPMPAYPPTQVQPPSRPAKDQDIGLGVRSILLEEFRSNSKSTKRYELKDLYEHIVEFSGDQHGSRFIQQKLETANSDEKEQLFREIQPNALQLMTDVFGNYVIQKLFEHGNQIQKRVLAEQMRNHVMELSMQMYGCRVVQKALEHVLADQQAELVAELQADVLKCVKDQNGNHVVQKAIERVPTEHIQFIIEAFRGQVHVLAAHPYGCRVIQRILEYCKPSDQANILEELHQCASMLITDQYGNYVTQHIIQHGKPEDRAKVIRIVTSQLLTLSKHKFASNVVEKSIQFGTDDQRHAIVAQLTILHSDGSSPLQLMMKDQYGNYVIQKLLAQLKGAERDAFVEDMKPQLTALKKYNYGKQIAAIEKLIFTGPQSFIPSTISRSQPIEINSSVPTPTLTNGQNSPQSSSLPSTNVSTIDDPNENASSDKTVNEKNCPEVVINGV